MTIERIFIEPRTPTWYALRRPLVTASDIGAAAGVDPFKTAFQLYAEKAGEMPPQGDNGAMRRGRFFEGAAIEYLREELPGWRIIRPNVFVADRENRLGATPDALAEDPADPGLVNIQIKVVNQRSFDLWNGTPPLAHRLQVGTENMLLDAKAGILAVLVISSFDAELHLFDVERHAQAEHWIREVAREFWFNVEHGIRPAPDYERDAETIAAMFPRPEPGKVLDLSFDNRLAEIMPRRMFLTDRMSQDKKERDALDAEIKLKLGDAEVAELPGWRLTWKTEVRNYKAKEAFTSTSRPLHVKQIEEQEKAA